MKEVRFFNESPRHPSVSIPTTRDNGYEHMANEDFQIPPSLSKNYYPDFRVVGNLRSRTIQWGSGEPVRMIDLI